MSRLRPKRARKRNVSSVPEVADIAATVRAGRLWRNEVYGCLKFLDGLADARAIHGQDWAERMKHHYIERLRKALDHAPAGVELEVPSLRERLTRLVS